MDTKSDAVTPTSRPQDIKIKTSKKKIACVGCIGILIFFWIIGAVSNINKPQTQENLSTSKTSQVVTKEIPVDSTNAQGISTLQSSTAGTDKTQAVTLTTSTSEQTTTACIEPEFDETVSNNAAAEILANLYKSVSAVSAVMVETSKEKIGCKNIDDFAKEQATVFIQVRINSGTWNTADNDTKKDIVSNIMKISRNIFPKANPHTTILNNTREVASGSYGLFGGENIDLK